MKKQLFLIGLIFTMFVAFAQTTETKSETQPTATADTVTESKDDFCPHRILFRFGGGYANNMFKELKNEIPGLKKCSYTAMAEIGYTYFFHRNIGIGLGVGINYTARTAKINETVITEVDDPIYFNGDLYDMEYSTKDLKQRTGIWAIEIPLTVQFEKRFGRNGIYAGIGVKGYIPISARAGFKDGEIQIDRITDRALNVTYRDLLYHMNPIEFKDNSVPAKMKASIDLLGEFGGVIGLSRSADLYLGLYASYGFLNILPKNENGERGIDLTPINTGDRRLAAIGDRYVNTSEKWNLFQVGLKVGFHFLPCKSKSNDEFMRDRKRRFMDEMEKKQNEPIVITNTTQEFYYFVPTISQELLDESGNDPAKKKALMDLAQSLSMIKILFPLDSDVPSLSDRNRDDIRKAVDILRANTDLKIIITGYTSPEGSQAHNEDLAQRRANAVKGIFVDRGVDKDQIATAAFTANDPQHKIDIPERESYPQQRAVIFKIEKR